ncbi:MAG: PqiC family protein [Verrucomicrobia bacterium]|nr:PqiC family protein [Verrucomicrobiota bacterium]MDA1065406.1 PqiC family protein [Verrucomicrobiota bacterium]
MRISFILLTLSMLVFSVGCIGIGGEGDLQPTHYYTLTAIDPIEAGDNSAETVIEVGFDQVEVPDYLDRKEIAVRTGENELRYTERNLWAERPSVSLQRILTQNIERQSSKVLSLHALPWPDHSDPDIIVHLKFQSFEAQESPEARLLLKVSWTVQSTRDGTIYKQGYFGGENLKWDKGNYSNLARGLSNGLSMVSQLIAEDLDDVVDELWK